MSESGGYRRGTCTLLPTALIESFTAYAGTAVHKAESCRFKAQINLYLPKRYQFKSNY